MKLSNNIGLEDNNIVYKNIKFSSVEDLLKTIGQVNVYEIKHLIKVRNNGNGISFFLGKKNIGNLILDKKYTELSRIDNINGTLRKRVIKGLGYFMIKYALSNFNHISKQDEFLIYCVLDDVTEFYEKVSQKLKEEGIIKSYKWVSGKNCKDLIFYL